LSDAIASTADDLSTTDECEEDDARNRDQVLKDLIVNEIRQLDSCDVEMETPDQRERRQNEVMQKYASL